MINKYISPGTQTMKLTDFDKNPIQVAQKTLKEHYGTSIEVTKLSYPQVSKMLSKVRSLIKESRQSRDFYESQTNPAYLKLVFMEQALAKHFETLSANRPRIVTENEEVEKSQVVLAAQDMVNEVRKMIEQVSDMLVKELPALVDSMQSEMGVNESTTFNSQVTEALTAIQAALTQGEATLKDALNSVTGQGGGVADMGAAPAAEPDMGGEMGADLEAPELAAPTGEEDLEADIDIEEPEEPLGGVGREKR